MGQSQRKGDVAPRGLNFRDFRATAARVHNGWSKKCVQRNIRKVLNGDHDGLTHQLEKPLCDLSTDHILQTLAARLKPEVTI